MVATRSQHSEMTFSKGHLEALDLNDMGLRAERLQRRALITRNINDYEDALSAYHHYADEVDRVRGKGASHYVRERISWIEKSKASAEQTRSGS